MVEAVREDRVVTPDKRWNDGQVGHVAGGEEERTRETGESGELLLERRVGGEVAADQVRGAAADPPGACTGAGGLDQCRVIGQAEVVVAAKADQIPAVDPGLRAARPFERATLAFETGVLQRVEFALQFFPDHVGSAASSAAMARVARNVHSSLSIT